ncbi:MAG TPA: hypothetical protein VFX96_07445 [Pyrinomonadaceae bacterium]|nr:hypothetical protein [Pyrinomonadaceae bacterium]
MNETQHFINEGFGWTCKRCREADAAHASPDASPDTNAPLDADATHARGEQRLPRFFREGEAEERDVRLSSKALARWRESDDGRKILFCPACGAEEELREG